MTCFVDAFTRPSASARAAGSSNARLRLPNAARLREISGDWARTEAKQLLGNRSGYLSIHTEDLMDVTDRMRVVYKRQTV
jgi:hypothetical protein